jgi:hypothetical protein
VTQFIFVGPTFGGATPEPYACAAGVVFLPPVAGGDLLRLRLKPGDLVGLIDGYFHQQRAVWHKEILDLMNRGVTVLGAASIGALRAAELDVFGMIGVGKIYLAYRDGKLEADDEVTLMHGPADSGYRALSDPLVNMRATLRAAVDDGVCEGNLGEQLMTHFSGVSYPQRSYRAIPAVAERLGAAPAAIERLVAFCESNAVDVKRPDALELLAKMAELEATGSNERRAIDVSRTIYLYAWQLEARGEAARDGGTWIGEVASLRAAQLFAEDYPKFHRRLVLRWIAAQCRDECARPDATKSERDVALEHGAHLGLYGEGALEQHEPWLAPWLRGDEAERSPRDRLEAFVVRGFRFSPGVCCDELALAALKELPSFSTAQKLVELAASINEQTSAANPQFRLDSLAHDRIVDFITARWKISARDLDLAAMDRGLDSIEAVVAAARQFYLLAKYNPSRALFTLSISEP